MRGAVLFAAMKLRHLLPTLALIVTLTLLLLTAGFIIDRLASLPARAVHSASNQAEIEVAKVRDAFIELFHMQPNISLSENVVLDQTATTPELAIVSRDVEVRRDAMQTWWGSTKTIRMHSVYRVKAGFDLSHDELQVQLRESGIAIGVPRAKILSVEPILMNIEELRDGLWNKIQASDVEREVKRMPEIARAKSDSLPEEAEQTFKRLLAQKIADQNIRLEFISKAVPPN
jgi:hypothetical protein